MTERVLWLNVSLEETIMPVHRDGGPKAVEDLINVLIARAAYIRQIKAPEGSDPTASLENLEDFDRLHPTYCWHDSSPLRVVDRQAGHHAAVPPLVRSIISSSTSSHMPQSIRFIGYPPSDSVSCFDVLGEANSKKFTSEGPGRIYRNFLEDLMQLIEWPSDVPRTQGLTLEESQRHYHLILPSFLNLLSFLSAETRNFVMFLRSLGPNIEAAARALDIFSWGKHPMHVNVNLHLLSKSRRYSDHISWKFEHAGEGASAPVVLKSCSEQGIELDTPEKIYQLLHRASGMGMVEDIEHWDRNKCHFAAGKKLLFTKDDKKVHPVIFDANHLPPQRHAKGEKLSEQSSIAILYREKTTDKFQTLRYLDMLALENMLFVKVDVLQAMLDPQYFIQCFKQCDSNFMRLNEELQHFRPHLSH
mmetsp:Transcript_1132/g.3553  ORF Transcript_1132/g.3553 Transcript_1132/m.3553 type:complete len:417 (+) Transcript_1132:78-1328(+)